MRPHIYGGMIKIRVQLSSTLSSDIENKFIRRFLIRIYTLTVNRNDSNKTKPIAIPVLKTFNRSQDIIIINKQPTFPSRRPRKKKPVPVTTRLGVSENRVKNRRFDLVPKWGRIDQNIEDSDSLINRDYTIITFRSKVQKQYRFKT